MKLVKYVVFPIVALVALLIIVGFFMPERLEVRVTKELNVSVQEVYPEISNLKNWQNWSPWKDNDPNMKISRNREVGGVGQTQEWKSETEGNGKLEITNAVENELVAYDLTFVDWNAVSKGSFKLKSIDNERTEITWEMIGAETGSPFGRLMNAFFASTVEEDFNNGLLKLERQASR